MTSENVINELERIRLADPERKLRPEQVVDAARPLTHLLHSKFEWDDGVAAEKHRLQQARQLIRVTVITLPNDSREVKAYCSLSVDRAKGNDGASGGYRSTIEVMSDRQLTSILLSDALNDLHSFKARYGRLNALANVFVEIDRLQKAGEKKAKRARNKKKIAKAQEKAKKKTTKKAGRGSRKNRKKKTG